MLSQIILSSRIMIGWFFLDPDCGLDWIAFNLLAEKVTKGLLYDETETGVDVLTFDFIFPDIWFKLLKLVVVGR